MTSAPLFRGSVGPVQNAPAPEAGMNSRESAVPRSVDGQLGCEQHPGVVLHRMAEPLPRPASTAWRARAGRPVREGTQGWQQAFGIEPPADNDDRIVFAVNFLATVGQDFRRLDHMPHALKEQPAGRGSQKALYAHDVVASRIQQRAEPDAEGSPIYGFVDVDSGRLNRSGGARQFGQ